MALFRKAGNILGRTVNNHISVDSSSSKPFIFQAIRCMSTSKLFVGGLSYSTDDTSLREVFSKYGEVYEAKVIVDRDTGRSRGFGFVNYYSVEEASAAIQALDQQEIHGRQVRVNYANERTRGYNGGGGGGFRGGNFDGGYNGGGGGGNYGTGGGYNNNDGYGSGNYGTVGNPNFAGNNYGSGVETAAYPTNGRDSHTGGFDGGNLSYGSDEQSIGAVSGGSGNNFIGNGSTSASSGYDGFGDKFGSEGSNVFGKDDSLEGNYRDDDNIPGNYADRRG